MLRKIYTFIIDFFDNHPRFKLMYYRFAVFCSNHGIRPPLSGKASKVEKEWRDQHQGHPSKDPYFYVEHDESVNLLFLDVLPFLDKDAKILEIGCNAGRNLNYLHAKGYKDLTGIEIGIKAKEVMQQCFQEAFNSTTFILGNAYEELIKLPTSHYDLVFAHSVLINIAPKWNGIFKEMARVSKRYILTMESEGGITAYPRNFETMFKRAGCKQILYKYYNLVDGKRVLSSRYNIHEIFKNNTIRLFVPVQKG